MVIQRTPLGESDLHDIVVRLAGADQALVRPDRNPSPLSLLDDVRIGLLDQGANQGQCLAPPIEIEGTTNNNGVDTYSWKTSNDYTSGKYELKVDVSYQGYIPHRKHSK